MPKYQTTSAERQRPASQRAVPAHPPQGMPLTPHPGRSLALEFNFECGLHSNLSEQMQQLP